MTDKPEIHKNVYAAINAVQADLAKQGISKNQKNVQQNFKYRGIDDIYNAVAPLLAKHGLVIMPNVKERLVVERASKNGGVIFSVTVMVDFSFISSNDGSNHSISVYGEAMDSADKATNKALSAAYKYACLMVFCIPTEGENDADGTTHEIAAPVDEVAESAFDWKLWLKNTGAAVRETRTAIELDNLVSVNAIKMNELAGVSPSNHAKMLDLIKQQRENLTDDKDVENV